MERTETDLERLAGLRKLVEFLEQHPEVQVPWSTCFLISVDTKEELTDTGRAMDTFEKHIDTISDTFDITKDFGGKVKLTAYIKRDEVCERVVTGVEEVEEQVPVQFETRKVKKEIVEWRCPEGFAVLAKGVPQWHQS